LYHVQQPLAQVTVRCTEPAPAQSRINVFAQCKVCRQHQPELQLNTGSYTGEIPTCRCMLCHQLQIMFKIVKDSGKKTQVNINPVA